MESGQANWHDGRRRTALVFGRFQPFHLGHQVLLLDTVTQYDFTRILVSDLPTFRIGTKRTSKADNPFTYSEREEMIKDTMRDMGISGSRFDVEPFSKAVLNLLASRKIPESDIYTVVEHGKLTYVMVGILKAARRDTESAKERQQKIDITGSEVRILMNANGEWEPLVPKATANVARSRLLA